MWVNDAFTSVFARFVDIEPEEFRRVTEVTYLGFVNGTRAALRRMLPRDRGVIVQVGLRAGPPRHPAAVAPTAAPSTPCGASTSRCCTELRHERSNVHVTSVAMPAVNTPQFTWVLSRLPTQAQPVPPFYQPEVAARAVLYAADHPQRRAYWVGAATAAHHRRATASPAGLLDRYLARTGVSSQQTDDAQPADQPANLWEPVDGEDGHDFGAHGVFDDRAIAHSPQQWASQHRRELLLAGAGLAAGAALRARRPA